MKKPTLFIGSSTEQRDIALCIQSSLQYDANPIVWTQGTFEPSHFPLESLENALDIADFAVLVCVPEDKLLSREQTLEVLRDNIVFELGLFIGRLGRKRTFLVSPRGKQFHLPTDLKGLYPETYDPEQLSNPAAALGPACTTVLTAMKKLGPLPRHERRDAKEVAEDPREVDVQPLETASPTPDWSVRDYEFQLLVASVDQNAPRCDEVLKAFNNSDHARSPLVLAQWEAFQQVVNIYAGKRLELNVIRDKTDVFPDDAKLKDYLARGLLHYEERRDAANAFLEAVCLSKDLKTAAPIVKRTLEAVNSEEAAAFAQQILHHLAALSRKSRDDESLYAKALQELASAAGFARLANSLGEVVLTLSPDDTDIRFELARAYHEADCHSLSMLHYEKIPRDLRTEATWNNLGVSYTHLQIRGKAVDAYETSIKSGGVLASSNLAHKLVAAGFFEEASRKVNEALKTGEHRDELLDVLTTIQEARSSEASKLSDIKASASEQAEHWLAIGKAALEVHGPEIAGDWQTTFGLISLQPNEKGQYVGKGEFKEEVSSPLGGLFGVKKQIVTSEVSVLLSRFGNALEGTIAVSGSERPLTILGSLGLTRNITLKINSDGTILSGIERHYGDTAVEWTRSNAQTLT